MWELDHKEGLALKNWCFLIVVLEKTLEWVHRTARRSDQSDLKEINPEYSLKDWCWSWSSNTLGTWFKELTHWNRFWCWERLRTGGEDGWMVSQPQRPWVWANSLRYWRRGNPGELQSMKSQKSQTWLNNSTTTAFILTLLFSAKSLQSCPTLCDPMDYSPPDSSVHGILQTRIMGWVTMSSSRGSSLPRDQTYVSYVSYVGRRVFFCLFVCFCFFFFFFFFFYH